MSPSFMYCLGVDYHDNGRSFRTSVSIKLPFKSINIEFMGFNYYSKILLQALWIFNSEVFSHLGKTFDSCCFCVDVSQDSCSSSCCSNTHVWSEGSVSIREGRWFPETSQRVCVFIFTNAPCGTSVFMCVTFMSLRVWIWELLYTVLMYPHVHKVLTCSHIYSQYWHILTLFH